MPSFIIKIDVDTERGTRIGVPNMVTLFKKLDIPATFLFSLGPDNTGRALKRVFRPGFLKKVSRTSVVEIYGIKTLLNGVLWPGPHIAKKHKALMQSVEAAGFDVGIHCYDHSKWQDGVTTMPAHKIMEQFLKAVHTFEEVFSAPPPGAGAPGWQANAKTLAIYDACHLQYGSDCRGKYPFIPKIKGHQFKTLQIPTTLPTLDELLGRPEYPIEKLTDHLLSLFTDAHPNVMTCHAELEGMKYLEWFESFLTTLKEKHIQFNTLGNLAKTLNQHRENIPLCEMIQGEVDGRSGLLAIQKTIVD